MESDFRKFVLNCLQTYSQQLATVGKDCPMANKDAQELPGATDSGIRPGTLSPWLSAVPSGSEGPA
jgi:hypothetical protein